MKINISTLEIKNEIISALHDGRGLSLLRFGDGELIIATEHKNINICCINHIGRIITEDELHLTKKNFIYSILNADILSLPGLGCNHSIWAPMVPYYESIKNAHEKEWKEKKYCSIYENKYLLTSGGLFEIFNQAQNIVIVSSRNIVDKLYVKFPNIKNIKWYPIPAEQKYESIKNTNINIFDEFEKIHIEICKESRKHQLLIFGTGPFGKHLGANFASYGGVALDLGSIFDLFVGKLTRGPGKSATATIESYLL